SLISAIIKVLREKVREFNVRRVLQVNLTVGELTNVEEATLNAAFEVCVEGTELAGAKLVMERVPARGKCRHCATEFALVKYRLQCPQCNRQGVEIVAGKEFYLNSMEVE
ncbi:MAG: hydrogenase maturation nickel metallochaperone HypA, partial [Bacillota bacterium]